MFYVRLSALLSLMVLAVGCGSLRPANPDVRRTTRPGGTVDNTSHIRTDLVQHAQELLNTRYQWGGNRPNEGFDCSGLVVYLYQNAGLDNIARVSRDQAKQGKEVRRQQARPGDLVFYKKSAAGKVFHVSVVVEATPTELWVIHATSSRGVIREDVLASPYWRPKIYQVRNVFF